MDDPAVRAATTVSSEEMAEWSKQIPALKQVMVLDTCADGAARASEGDCQPSLAHRLHPPLPHYLATGIRIRSGPTHSSQELSQPV